jgi:hypothetical protein
MRLYRRTDFLRLPAGTLYCKGVQWAFSELCVKGETEGADFLLCNLQSIEYHDTEDFVARCEAMLCDGASVPLNTTMQRDGCFDELEIFLVYEPEDLWRMVALCEYATGVYRQEGAHD